MRNFSNINFGANLYTFYQINDEYCKVLEAEDKMQIIRHLAYLFETSLDYVFAEYNSIKLSMSENDTLAESDYNCIYINPSEARALFNLIRTFQKIDYDFSGIGGGLNSSIAFNYTNFNTGCSLTVTYIRA